MPDLVLPGDTIDFSELRVKNESDTDIYTLLEFTATISNLDSTQVETYTTWYNLAGEVVDTTNIDKDASKILKGQSGQASTLSYTIPTEIGNIYKNGKLKIDITTHAVQGRFGTTVGYEPLYASFLIIKNKTGENITSPLVDLTLVIDDSTQTYRVKKNSTLQNAIQETNTTANDYNSCGWFDDNEFLDCTDLTQSVNTNKTLYTKTATLDKLCFKNMETYYSVGGRLADGTTYLPYDISDKTVDDVKSDRSLSGEVVFPCRYINSEGLDLPVTRTHNLGVKYFREYEDGPFTDSPVSSFVFSTSITHIERAICRNNASITELRIPSSLISIDTPIKQSCHNINKAKVSEKNPVYHDIDDKYVLTTSTRTLKMVAETDKTLHIIEPIKLVDYASCERTTFENIYIADSIEIIGSYSFCSIGSLKNFYISHTSKLTSILQYAFNGCPNLNNIYIPSNVTSIENNAFIYCANLKTVTVDSPTIYNALTGTDLETCGGLIQYADTINVLKSVVDDPNNINTFLNDTSKYTKTSTTIDGYSYYQYKKVE